MITLYIQLYNIYIYIVIKSSAAADDDFVI